jgi:cytochrome c peroxidase
MRSRRRSRGRIATAASLLLPLLLIAAVGAGLADYRPPVPQGLDLYLPVPDDNRLTAEKVALGERLFFDPRLSRDGSVACASCHIPERAFSDSLPVAVGIDGRRGERNAPPIINLAWAGTLFRDGSARSLEEQALHPIHSSVEMDLSLDELEERLRDDAEYRRTFRGAFAVDPDGADGALSAANVARALASYVRTIFAGDAPFDRFLAGDRAALTEDEQRGFRLFTGKANCSVCHLGPTLSDDDFHNTGVAAGSGDPGRYGVTGRDEDQGRFRTPTLREIQRTAPYMHDGSLATLDEVIEFYDRGGEPHPNLSPEIRPLSLTEREKLALTSYLRALTGTVRAGVR